MTGESLIFLGVEWLGRDTPRVVTMLFLACVLACAIGLERNRKLKSAGLRTHALVGVGTAVFTLVSAYGFHDIGVDASISVDPTRIAAQVVSGIGFLGGGVIFVRQNVVSGLTTAASIWVTASVGMACGAGMPLLAITATVLQLLAVSVLGSVGRALRPAHVERMLHIRYREGTGALRNSLAVIARQGMSAQVVQTTEHPRPGKHAHVSAHISLIGADASNTAVIMQDLTDVRGVIRIEQVSPDED